MFSTVCFSLNLLTSISIAMAYFVSEHVPYITGIKSNSVRSCVTPTLFERQERLVESGTHQLHKRRSVLSLALETLISPRSDRSKTSSQGQYTLSRDSDSIHDGKLVQRYRCEILAVSSDDYIEAEAECKQIILEAGGTVNGQISYPGGFLFNLSYLIEPPIETGDETVGGGYIVVERVDSFIFGNGDRAALPESQVQDKHCKLWQVKCEHRLRKRSLAPPPLLEQNGCGRWPVLCKARDRLTAVEFLLEEARQRRALIEDETDWVTLGEDDDSV